MSLFRAFEGLPKFNGLKSMTLQVSLETLRKVGRNGAAGADPSSMQEVKQIIELVKGKLQGKKDAEQK